MTAAEYIYVVSHSMPNALDAQKALIASLPDGESDGGYAIRLQHLKLGAYLPTTPKQTAPFFSVPKVDDSTGILTDASGRKYQQVDTTVTTTDVNGNTQTESLKYNLFFYTITDDEGNTVSFWLPS